MKVPLSGTVTPAVMITPGPVEAATVMMGEPLASYEVVTIVPSAKVAIELMITEASVEASVADGEFVVWPIPLVMPVVDDSVELLATLDVIGRLSGPSEGTATVV